MSEEAKYIYFEIGSGYGFNGPEELALEIIQNKLDEYSKHQNKSLEEENQKLRESLKESLETLMIVRRHGLREELGYESMVKVLGEEIHAIEQLLKSE